MRGKRKMKQIMEKLHFIVDNPRLIFLFTGILIGIFISECIIGQVFVETVGKSHGSIIGSTVVIILLVWTFMQIGLLIILFSLFLKISLDTGFRKFSHYFSLVVFILIIIEMFALCYLFCFMIDINGFNGIDIESDNIYFTLLYFSVVTFTSLGYGDIYPVSMLARSVAMVEVLFFVIYISIILLSVGKSRIRGTQKDSQTNENSK